MSRNTTPHEREGKGEEGGALCDEAKTGRWETTCTYRLDLRINNSGTMRGNFQQLSCMARQYVNQKSEFRLFFII